MRLRITRSWIQSQSSAECLTGILPWSGSSPEQAPCLVFLSFPSSQHDTEGVPGLVQLKGRDRRGRKIESWAENDLRVSRKWIFQFGDTFENEKDTLIVMISWDCSRPNRTHGHPLC